MEQTPYASKRYIDCSNGRDIQQIVEVDVGSYMQDIGWLRVKGPLHAALWECWSMHLSGLPDYMGDDFVFRVNLQGDDREHRIKFTRPRRPRKDTNVRGKSYQARLATAIVEALESAHLPEFWNDDIDKPVWHGIVEYFPNPLPNCSLTKAQREADRTYVARHWK